MVLRRKLIVLSQKSQESKEAFEREKQMHLEHEAKFIDDLKRAILLDGGYVKSLDQEVNIWGLCVLWRQGACERARAARGSLAGMECSSEAFYVAFYVQLRQNLAQTVHSIEHAIVCGIIPQHISRSLFDT